ncbi:hypothetical protein DOY81_014514 [Sarcophaga bullata]|nr:hypothetical protein DOY81_014514 [Sarcophaga bullata]
MNSYIMKFIIILALLCLSYAEEQSTTTVSAVGQEPPKHIKDFVEQHIKHVKQQIPIIQQQIKEGKVHVEITKPVVNGQQVPEHIKQFINSHINQVLQHIANKNQVKQLHVTLETTPSLGVPQFVVDKINKLQDHVKQIMQQAETHIPQIINQQIAYKQKIKNKETVPEVIVEKKVSRRSVTETPKEQTGSVGVKPVVVPTLVQEIVQQVHQHIPQVVAHHVAQVQKGNVEKKQVVVPSKVQGIVQQIHQHVPQVISQHVAHHQNVGHQIKTRSIKDEVKVTETPKEQKDVVDIKPVVVPPVVQGIVEQVHQHVPQVVSQVQNQNIENETSCCTTTYSRNS